MICVRGAAILRLLFWIILIGIQSIPGAEFFGNLLITLIISEGLAGERNSEFELLF